METAKMIKVLLADDESIVRKGLRSTVPWHKYGMEVVADAPNGLKAWEAYQTHRPQVIITDIVMPEMNGIELLRKVKEADKEARIVLLSCHRDFEYAQQGIKLGASGYLLKTAFEDEELEGMLEKFQAELTAPAAVENVVEDSREERLGSLLLAWLSGHSDKFIAKIGCFVQEEWLPGEGPLYVYLLKAGGCGGNAEVLDTAQDREGRLLRGVAVIPYGEELCYWIVPASAAETADSLLLQMKSKAEKLRWARRGPLPLEDTGGISSAFRELHKEAELEKLHGISSGDWPEPIWKAVKLLYDNPGADWSVSDLAGQVGLSRSHFSTLFKKTVGDSFVAFQYKRKLKLATELLRGTQLTMQDIAERTGLGDSKYFSKWFKRCMGLTPSHYRTQQKGALSRTDEHPKD
ncbi:response regulator transcription factor [Paenibacillus tuaregi]|uniref:response regulator transcription factor n=1 Tax=Paenibacillus tuaregi TaxID=1816681 RepID=UPI00083930B2|nr:response regulator [Paenibacillus tuaregi]